MSLRSLLRHSLVITQHINRSNGVLKIPYRLSNTNSKEVRVVGTNETDFNPNFVLLLRFNSESCSWLEKKGGKQTAWLQDCYTLTGLYKNRD